MSDASAFETPPRPPVTAAGAVLTAIAVAALYFGRDILVPLALATLLVFVLTPPLQWLRRQGLPKVVAVVLVTTAAALGIGGVMVVVGGQLVQLAEGLPGYQANIKSKLADLRAGLPGTGLLSRVSETIDAIGNDLRGTTEQPPSESPSQSQSGQPEQKPIPVTITSAPLKPLEMLETYIGPLLTPLATAALVVLFVIFILIEREELRDRFIALVSAGNVQRSTEAIMDAADRVSRYLLMQLIVNASYGIAIGAGLWLIGVPNAVLWGILAGTLRFIPYLGPWLAAIMPILLAFASAPGWTMVLLAAGLFVVMELVSNNIMEPLLYGSTTGLSSFAIILAAIFWTLLWGPIGLLLATPLTVCLVVVGRYVPRLEFLDLLLGSAPVLSPAERLYQRLLSGNGAEALDLAEKVLQTESTAAFIEQVALPALRLAEHDRVRGANAVLRRNVADGIASLVEEIGLDSDVEMKPASPRSRLRVICVGGRTELDASAATLLAAHLEGEGHHAEAKAPVAISPGVLPQLDAAGADYIALCYLERRPARHARMTCRRLRRQQPHVGLLVCCFNLDGEEAAAGLEAELAGKGRVATSIASVDRQLDVAGEEEKDEAAAARGELTLADILQAARQMRLETGTGEDFARLTAPLAPILDGSLVLIALADPRRTEGDAESPRSQQAKIAEIVAARSKDRRAPLAVPNVAEDAELAGNELLLEKGIRSFAATPIFSASDQYVGALCLLDAEERTITPEAVALLERTANEIGAALIEPRPVGHAAPGARAHSRAQAAAVP